MTAAKRKGTAFETLLVRALGAFFRLRYGLKPYRPAQAGQDVGDLNGISPWVGQAKAFKSWEDAMRLGLDGAERQKVAAGEAYGVAFVKRPRRSVGQAYAVMTVETWARVTARMLRAEELLSRSTTGAYAMHVAETAADLATEFPRGTEGKATE
ncbi:hypothetical protein AB0J27_20375 [Micromonospora chokoriensis]